VTGPALDRVIHPINHLRLCAALATVEEAEFAALRDTLGVADPALSKYLKALQNAGYVTLSKPVSNGRRRTWASLTPAGRAAFRAHVAALQRLAAPVPGPSGADAVGGEHVDRVVG
jgi:DNA-binding MarR family transcriptional regulator